MAALSVDELQRAGPQLLSSGNTISSLRPVRSRAGGQLPAVESSWKGLTPASLWLPSFAVPGGGAVSCDAKSPSGSASRGACEARGEGGGHAVKDEGVPVRSPGFHSTVFLFWGMTDAEDRPRREAEGKKHRNGPKEDDDSLI